MIIAYGYYALKKYMAKIHLKHPEVSLMYLGAVNDITIVEILGTDTVDLYLYMGEEKETYLTSELRNKFSGKVFDTTEYFVENGQRVDFDEKGFFEDLRFAIQELA